MAGWFSIRNTALSLLTEQPHPWQGIEALRIGWVPHLSADQLTV